MFDNIGVKIQKVAKVIVWINIFLITMWCNRKKPGLEMKSVGEKHWAVIV